MSQHRPGQDGGLEGGFLDSDVELEIAHPSPNAEIYARTSSFSFPPLPVIAGGLVALAVGTVGVFYYGYQRGIEEGQRSLPPVVLADPSPIKKAPEEVPGGIAKAPEDLNIYDVARGQAAPRQAPATPASPRVASPADNADGSIESLISRSENIATDPTPERIQRLQQSGIEVSPPRPDLNREPSAPVAAPAPTPAPAPQAQPAPTPAPAPATIAQAPKPAAPAPAAPVAPLVAQTGGDTYMVQLAASRSRALARGVFANLQTSYEDLLGRRDPLILRVDLGAKGIFYRVNVPGFAGRVAASQFCNTLKKRGQDCLVRKQP